MDFISCLEQLRSNSIQHLSLIDTNPWNKRIILLSEALSENTSLQTLDLNHSHLGDRGFEYLAPALLKNKALKRLSIHLSRNFNYIGNIGAEALAEALLKNTSLEILELGNNNIGQKGIICFREALRKNPSLKDVSGIRLVENVENQITLKSWRLEIHSRRRKLQRILKNVIAEVNLVHVILQMESAFPYKPKNGKFTNL